MHEMKMWKEARVVVAGKGLKQQLEWLIRADESQPVYTNLDDGSEGDASDVIQKINREKIGGYDDWRLPDKLELYALVGDPEEPKSAFRFWSSSPTGRSEIGWHYWFGGGMAEPEPRRTSLPVRPVRTALNRDPAADEEEAARWCDSEPSREGSIVIGIVELIKQVSVPILKSHPQVQISVRRYSDNGAIAIFATLDGRKASVWSEDFANDHSASAEDFMAMRRAFPELVNTGSGGGWIDRFPVKVEHLVSTIVGLLSGIGVHICGDGDDSHKAFCTYVRREVLPLLPRCYKIRVGNRVFTFGML